MALGKNIRQAREAAGLTLEQLSERSGVEIGTISALEVRDSVRSQYVTQLARALGTTESQLLSRHGTPSTGEVEDQGQPLAATLRAIPTLDWRGLMLGKLPVRFEVAAPDDSMAPRVRQGQMLTFDTSLEPRPGDGVLVTDSDGTYYFRVFRQRRADAWEAHALNDAYQALSSVQDGLRIVAVLVGVQARWS